MVGEVTGKTPAHAQETATYPHNFAENTQPPKKDWKERPDPANVPELALRGTFPRGENLWPNEANQPRRLTREEVHARKRSSIAIGDQRLSDYTSTTKRAFASPGSDLQTGLTTGKMSESARSVAATKTASCATRLSQLDPETRAFKYKRALERVQSSAFPVEKMEENFVLRLVGKVRVDANNNGFSLRRMFREFDPEDTGMVELEEFMAGLLDKGVQFTEEQFLALFARYDTENQGFIPYNKIASSVLDRDLYSLSFSGTEEFDDEGVYTRPDQRKAFFTGAKKDDRGVTIEQLTSGQAA